MYLRKIGTNEVFAFSTFLMQRGDMVPYTGPIPVPTNFDIPEAEITFMKYIQAAKEKKLNPNQLQGVQGVMPPFPPPEVPAPPPGPTEIVPPELTALKIEGDQSPPLVPDGDYKINAIAQAIAELNPENDFTTKGLPKVEAIEQHLGIQITMQERDIAWQKHKEQSEAKPTA